MNMFKNKKLLVVFLFIVLVFILYKWCGNREYFVVKMGQNDQEILLDHADFAEIMNGLKPKSVTGTFTKDDLSELIREFKRHGIDTFQANDNCFKNRSMTPQCEFKRKVVALIKEASVVNAPGTGEKITTKDQWLKSIVDLASSGFLGRQNEP